MKNNYSKALATFLIMMLFTVTFQNCFAPMYQGGYTAFANDGIFDDVPEDFEYEYDETEVSADASASSDEANVSGNQTAGEQEETVSFDVPDYVKINYGILTALGITDESFVGDYRPGKYVTRAEFAECVVRMLGLDTLADRRIVTPFEDVSEEHPASGSVCALYDMKLIASASTSCFYPDEPISYEQAVGIIVCALGYDFCNLQTGMNQSMYVAVASKAGLLDGIETYEENLTVEVNSQLLINSLEAEYVKRFTVDGTAYGKSQPERTLLSDVFGVHKDTGIISADRHSSLTSPEGGLSDNRIKIDDVIYRLEKYTYTGMLGRLVEFYYSDDNSFAPTLIYMYPPESDDVLKIDANEIISVSSDLIIYETADSSGKEKRAYLSPVLDVIYNGKAYPEYEDSDLMPEYGNITLIKNSGKGAYDVVLVEEYETYVVESVSKDSQTISVKYFQGQQSIIETKDFETEIFRDGKEFALKKLENRHVIDVMSSRNTKGDKIKRIFVSDRRIAGTISETDGEYVVIEGERFKISKSYFEYLERIRSGEVKGVTLNDEEITVNTSGVFYLNKCGEIAGYRDDQYYKPEKYGYLLGMKETGKLESSLKVKLLDETGNIIEYRTANKYKINDMIADVNTAKIAFANNGELEKQLIVYVLNSKGEISRLYYATENENDMLYTYDRLDCSTGNGASFRSGANTFGGIFHVDNSTVIFTVPYDESDDTLYKVTSFAATGQVPFKNSLYYNVKAYNTNRIQYSPVMVYYENLSYNSTYFVSAGEPICVVDKITTAIDEEGRSIKKLHLLQSGVKRTLTAAYDPDDIMKISTLKRGDIIQYNANKDNIITGIVKRADPVTARESVGSPLNSCQFSFVTVFDRYDDYIVTDVSTKGGTRDTAYSYKIGTSQIYLIETPDSDNSEGEVSIVSSGDIQIGDKIYISARYGTPYYICIIR